MCPRAEMSNIMQASEQNTNKAQYERSYFQLFPCSNQRSYEAIALKLIFFLISTPYLCNFPYDVIECF